METTHIFKEGDTAHTIWGEEVILEKLFDPDFIYTLTFRSKHLGYVFSITKHGLRVFDDPETIILFPHPVRVAPIPEFEEGEEIEVSVYAFDSGITPVVRRFVYKDKSGKYICEAGEQNKFASHESWPFARKITKPEKTRTELMEELIEKQKEYVDFLGDCVTRSALHYSIRQIEASEQEVEMGNQLRSEISSLQDKLKQIP